MKYPVIMHVNYCEQGQAIDDLCGKAADWGFDGVEFRRRRIGIEESVEGYLDALEAGVRSSGLRHVVFGYPGPLLFKESAEDRAREVADAVRFYRHVAGRFGVRTVNLLTGQLRHPSKSVPDSEHTRHGSFLATEEQFEWHAEGCREMAEALADLGIRFAFETHMAYIHDTVEATKRLVRRIGHPSVGVNLDYGNIVEFPEYPSLEDAVKGLQGLIHYVHLKNSVPLHGLPRRLPTALAEGEINNRQFLRLLKAAGYEGPICIEAPRAGDREWFARQDIAYLRSVLRDLGME